MSKDLQSIEDLMSSSQGKKDNDDDSAQVKFAEQEKKIKLKEQEKVTKGKADALGVSYIDLVGFPISPEALSVISEEDSKKIKSVCFYYDGSKMRIASLNPKDETVINKKEELVEAYHCEAKLYLISEHSYKYAMDMYRMVPKTKKVVKGVEITEEDLNKYSEKFSSFRNLQDQISKAEISDIITIIMASSVKSGSSDIHIEAEEDNIKVRFRIDGILHDVAAVDKHMWKKIISRLKVLAGVKINVDNKPQDGRISIITKKERIDIRASFLPTNYGESVVMRLLRSGAVGLDFEDLGIRGEAFEQLKRETERPNGMIVTTGPTGSGKTTTLYAILKKLNKPETKIITVEDPIEYQLEGINQSQTSDKYTFAQGLRSIVRQDPDVIMVGEIRDLETSDIAIQAALTGHLVLSTIHTNDAAGAIPRFLSMGSKPFLLAPALNAVIGQRLVRKICKKCKKEIELDEDKKERVKKIIEGLPEKYKQNINFEQLKYFEGTGCDACQNLGYKGRLGIYEIMIMDEEIEKMIISGKASEYDMREVASKKGMLSMAQDGILKAIEGITSIKEVFRVADEK